MRESPACAETSIPERSRRFVRNVLWNWLGTAISLFIGFVLSPYLILKLGADGYGVWAITFALVEYYWFFDLGFRSATVKFVAHYSALQDANNVRAVISTAIVYSAIAGGLVLGAALVFAPRLERFFQIPANLRGSFQTLVLLVTFNWSLGLVLNVFNASLEAVQCFEYSTKASIVSAIVRAAGWASALYLGYQLIAIGVVAVLSQLAGYAVNYVYFQRVFPGSQFSIRRASFAKAREMARFGIHTFVMTISNQLLNQGAPVLIGHFRAAAFVGFYNLPVRLLQYTTELVGRIGIVTNTNAAELAVREGSQGLRELAIYVNRYCLVIFMPVAILLWTHGPRLLAFWVGAPFAGHSAAVLPILLAGYVVGVVGQFSAGMLLQGLGKHQRYARSLLLEALAVLILLAIAIPRWGIVGAAWVSAALMTLNRGFIASWLVSKTLGLRFARYVLGVYAAPIAVMAPMLALALWLRSTILPGSSWIQIAVAASLVATGYYALAFFVALEPRHRGLLLSWVATRCSPAPVRGVAHG
jgi:O-antigen/teichoic acid export membrane protein